MKQYRRHRGVPPDVLAIMDGKLGDEINSRAKRARDGRIKPSKVEHTKGIAEELDGYRKRKETHVYPHIHMGGHLWQHPAEHGCWPFDSV